MSQFIVVHDQGGAYSATRLIALEHIVSVSVNANNHAIINLSNSATGAVETNLSITDFITKIAAVTGVIDVY